MIESHLGNGQEKITTIRIEKDRILTPVLEYTSRDARVTAIGMLHFAMPSFYEQVQQFIDQDDKGLYEHGDIQPAGTGQTYRSVLLEAMRECEHALHIINSRTPGFAFESDSLSYPEGWISADIPYSKRFEHAPNHLLLRSIRARRGFLHIFYPFEKVTVPKEKFLNQIWEKIQPKNLSEDVLEEHRVEERDALFCKNIDNLLEENTTKFSITCGAYHLTAIDAHLQTIGFNRKYKEWLCAMERES